LRLDHMRNTYQPYSDSTLSLFRAFSSSHNIAPYYIYLLFLHDALPIFHAILGRAPVLGFRLPDAVGGGRLADLRHDRARARPGPDRKSTRLNSSHVSNSYAVSTLKKKEH